MRIFARRGGSMRSRYRDRFDAGAVLARRLGGLAGRPDLLVLALPRGGVPVAFEVARRLGAELDVFVVRKLGVPGQEQLAMGAIASGGIRVLNESVIEALGIDDETIEAVAAAEQRELERREHLFGGERRPRQTGGRTGGLAAGGQAAGWTFGRATGWRWKAISRFPKERSAWSSSLTAAAPAGTVRAIARWRGRCSASASAPCSSTS